MSTTATPLRHVDPGELRVGLILPGHLRDAKGQIVARAGCTLSKQDLDTLSERLLYAGPDWHDCERPIEAAAPERPAPLHEHRHHKRHQWQATITLELEERADQGVSARRIQVTTHNLSAGGFAFIHRQYVHPGTTVIAQLDALADQRRLRGVVRSCIAIGGVRYRVGVQFTRITRDEPEEGG